MAGGRRRRHAGEDPRTGLLPPALVRVLRSDKRVLCVLNRTGRARLLACAGCGELARCERCDAAVSQPSSPGDVLACGLCGETRPVVCLHCGKTRLKALRQGVTRVRDEIEALVGEPVAEVTGSATRAKAGAAAPAGADVDRARVVVGTEAGLHQVARADVVAFLDLDQELLAPRYRAAEQALGLVARAARLVGGRERGGRLLLQTHVPDHEVVQAAVLGDPTRVADAEAERRHLLRFPRSRPSQRCPAPPPPTSSPSSAATPPTSGPRPSPPALWPEPPAPADPAEPLGLWDEPAPPAFPDREDSAPPGEPGSPGLAGGSPNAAEPVDTVWEEPDASGRADAAAPVDGAWEEPDASGPADAAAPVDAAVPVDTLSEEPDASGRADAAAPVDGAWDQPGAAGPAEAAVPVDAAWGSPAPLGRLTQAVGRCACGKSPPTAPTPTPRRCGANPAARGAPATGSAGCGATRPAPDPGSAPSRCCGRPTGATSSGPATTRRCATRWPRPPTARAPPGRRRPPPHLTGPAPADRPELAALLVVTTAGAARTPHRRDRRP